MIEQIILSKNINLHSQIPGVGQNLQPLDIILNVSKVISTTVVRQVMISVTIKTPYQSLVVTNTVSTADVDEKGNISVGTVYILGPVSADDIQYSATFTYVIS